VSSYSIVTETLEKGILISIDTSKESDFYADFKYISFIKSCPSKITLLIKFAVFSKKGRKPPSKP
jgi:hypothetical protein